MTAIRRLRRPQLGKLRSRRPRLTDLLATRLDITRGQASTMVVGLAIALLLALGGLPPVLRRGPAEPASLLGAPAANGAAPDATSDGGTTAATPVPPGADPLLSSPTSPVSSFPSFGGSSSSSAGSSSGSSSFDSTTSPTATGGGSAVRTTSVVAAVPGAAGIAVGGDRVVVASNGADNDSRLVVLRPDGSTVRAHAVAGRLTGVAVDGNTGFVGDAASGRILRVDLGSGATRVHAQLLDLPACGLVVAAEAGCEPGLRDDKPAPAGLARAGDGTLFVSDAGQGAIWRIPAGGGNPAVVTTDLAFSNGVSGIAVAGDGTLLVASPEAVDAEAAAGGAVYRVTSAGARTLLARFPRDASPSGVAVTAQGIVVTLRGAGAVVLLGEDGAEKARAAGQVGDATITAPVAVAVGGDGLLVTDRDSVILLTDL